MAAPYGTDSPSRQNKEMAELIMELPRDYDIIDGQWERYYRAAHGHEKWAIVAKQCVEFFEGLQWTDEEKNILESEGRPLLTLNKVAPLVRLILGYFRQNRYDINFMPGHDGSGSQAVAETLTAIAKQIGEVNQSDWKEAQMFQDGIQTGRGFLDHRLDFTKNHLGEVVEANKDPFSIYIDPEAETYDPNDPAGGWGYFLENRWLSPQDIYLMYNERRVDSVLNNMSTIPLEHGGLGTWFQDDISPSRYFGVDQFIDTHYDRGHYGIYASPFHHINRNRKLIRVLDCQYKVLKKCQYFVDLETGNETAIPDKMDRNSIARIMEYIQMHQLPITVRSGIRPRLRWTITAGDVVLYDEWSPYDRYTLVPYFPYFRRGQTRGMIHDLLDPQKEVNRRRSAFLHIVMTTANSGWIYEEGSMEEDMKRALEEHGSRAGVHVEYKDGFDAPRRIEPAASPVAMKKLEEDANNDMKEISSVNDSALGNLDRVQSGRAIQARQRQSIMGTELYFDNYSRTRELKGRNVMGIVQKYYNEPRILRIRGADGSFEEHAINVRDAAGEIVNNITDGIFTVAIDETPISSTYMQGQFAEAMELRENNIPIPDDVLVDLSSMPRKDEIKQRLEEEKAIRENAALIENLGNRVQLNAPLDQPLPPVAVSGEPPVQQSQPQQLPMPPQAPAQVAPQMPPVPLQPAPQDALVSFGA